MDTKTIPPQQGGDPLGWLEVGGGSKQNLVAGSARVWNLSGTQYETVEFCCIVGY